MFYGTLEKIKSTNNNLRTQSAEGIFDLPKVGRSFRLVGKGLTEGARYITTSEVKDVMREDKVIFFQTLNSTYKITLIEEINNCNFLRGTDEDAN